MMSTTAVDSHEAPPNRDRADTSTSSGSASTFASEPPTPGKVPLRIETPSSSSTSPSFAPTSHAAALSPRLRRCSSSISAVSSTHLRIGELSRHPSSSNLLDNSISGSATPSSQRGFGYGSQDDDLEYGLLISLGPKMRDDAQFPENASVACQIQFCVDHNYSDIHPHVYAPASLLLNGPVKAVGGGGSGVQVFQGEMPVLGPVVMKHGGASDMKELLALATITEELKSRGAKGGDPVCAAAAEDMVARCPGFKFIYIGPHHFRKRERSMWSKVREVVRSWNIAVSPSDDSGPTPEQHFCQPCADVSKDSGTSCGSPTDRSIKLCGCKGNSFSIQVHGDDCHALSFILPSCHAHPNECVMQLQGDGYDSLKSVVDQLLPLMEEHLFKFTLAQSKIGGSKAITGNELLYSGRLCGPVLDNLMTQMIQSIRNLQALTKPEEKDVIDEVRAELSKFEDEMRLPDSISKTTDTFVGNAIKKNFSANGRFHMLRKLGVQFRRCIQEIDQKNGVEHSIHQHFTEDKMETEPLLLVPEELVPAKHLGNLLILGALMGDTFHDAPMEQTTLQQSEHSWRSLLRRAIEPRRGQSSASLERIWNCGLSDAGLHNLFMSDNKLLFFDLGTPAYQSIPGFLTKFMFSFFHTLGMQEDDNGRWKCRFVERGGKLALTQESMELLPKAFDAFEVCLDRLIDDLFDADHSMRWLLLQYVTYQILSDASFCLNKWQIKGGGRPREANHHQDIEKWLWRALWDIYVAFSLNTQESWSRMLVTHPSQESSSFSFHT